MIALKRTSSLISSIIKINTLYLPQTYPYVVFLLPYKKIGISIKRSL